MRLWLTGEHRGKAIHHLLAGEVTVGRGAGNDLVLASQTVSRNHAKVCPDGPDAVLVIDLASLNGTRVNHKPVEKEQRAVRGDLVEFGSVALRVTDGTETGTPVWTDDENLSQSILLSREETRESGLSGSEPGVLTMLTEIGQLLVLPGDPEDSFDKILELVERQIPASRILILVSEKRGDEPVQRAARVRGDRAISPLMLSRTMVRMVLDDGASVLTSDAQADERFRNQQSIVAQDLHSAMAVPLMHSDEILGVLYVDTSDPLASYSERDLRLLTLLGQMVGTKVANARLLEDARERERLEEELRTAANIQQRLLPQTLPSIEGYEIVGRQKMCETVGGDLYDAGLLPDGRCQLILADVSGKGIGAALLMSNILATVRALRGVGVVSANLVRELHNHILSSTEPEHYATLFLGELDPKGHRLEYVNAGHPPAYLVTPDGRAKSLARNGFPVGLLDDPMVQFEPVSIELPAGSTLVVYSDGVSEAARGEEQFGDERFAAVLRECAGVSAKECSDKIVSAVASYLGKSPATDDTTLLVVHRRA
jgi:serine phosphatase RsbU (regulator of sigma subunit)